jgi:hypothetical protein
MDVEAIDLGEEIRQGIESGFDLAPVVFRGPVTREFLHGRERHALRKVRDGFPLRQACCGDTPAQVSQFRFRKVDLKRTNCIVSPLGLLCSTGLRHGISFSN